MKVLYIHQYFTTRDGNGGTRSYEFARYLVGQGHKVTMVAGKGDLKHITEMRDGRLITRVDIDGIDVAGVRVDYSNYMSYSRRALAFLKFMLISTWVCLRTSDVDLVYASSTPITVGVVGYVAALWHRKPFIFELRDLWPEYIENFGLTKSRLIIVPMRVLAGYLYRKARLLVVISDSMNRRVQSLYKGARGKVVTVPLGSDTDIGPAVQEVSVPGLKEGEFLVVYTGALGFVNDVEWLLHVAGKLKGKGVSFVIAGDGKTRPQLDTMKERMGLDNVYLLGKIAKRAVHALARKGDACVITSRYKDKDGRVYIYCEDSLSNKFFDYIAAGKPVLINFKSESSEYIEKFGCGIRLSPDDHEAAAREILRLKEDPELRRKMGDNARRLALERFDRTNLARQWERMLHETIAAAGRS